MAKQTYVCDCGLEYIPTKSKGSRGKIVCETCLSKIKTSEIKKKAVEYLGGKCIDCGFSGHPVGFDFDHKNPALKEFKISGHYILRWVDLKKELDKCVLLCATCHRVEHYKEDEIKRK